MAYLGIKKPSSDQEPSSIQKAVQTLREDAELAFHLGIEGPAVRCLHAGKMSPAALQRLLVRSDELVDETSNMLNGERPTGEEAKALFNAKWAMLDKLIGDEPAETSIDDALKVLERAMKLPAAMTCGEIMETQFPDPTWIIPELLTVGLTILAGAPKLGKSWLALALCAAVGSGGAALGKFRVQRRRAVYLALEDTPRRLKSRLLKIGADKASRFSIFTQWRTGADGLADLDAFLSLNEDVKLVVVDTLARFRGSSYNSDDRYAADYAFSAALKEIADRYEVAIVAVHHVRKMQSDDPMDMVSGTNGLNGGADATWILSRARGESDATLFATGRDIEEEKFALRFDPACASWTVMGDADTYAQGNERRAVLDAMPVGKEARTGEIATAIGKKPNAVAYLLGRLEKEGLVRSPRYGYWTRIATETPESTETNILQFQGFQDFQGDIGGNHD